MENEGDIEDLFDDDKESTAMEQGEIAHVTTSGHQEQPKSDLTDISTEQLHAEVKAIFQTADLSQTTVRFLVEALNKTHPHVDFTPKKPVIRGILERFAADRAEELQADIKRKEWEQRREDDGNGREKKMKYNQDSDSDSELDDTQSDIEADEREQRWREEDRETGGRRNTVKAKRGGGGVGFQKEVYVRPKLAEFLGVDTIVRTEITKQLWKHIKDNNLQDPADKRKIICDEKLQALFGQKRVGMFKMTGLVSKMILKPEEVGPVDSKPPKKAKKAAAGAAKGTKRKRDGAEESEADDEDNEDGDQEEGDEDDEGEEGEDDEDDEEEEEEPTSRRPSRAAKTKAEAKKAKAAPSKKKKLKAASDGFPSAKKENGFTKKRKISDALAAFLGVPEESRPQAVKALWVYIKEKALQNPDNKQEILCDDKLKTLFPVKKVTIFSMNKYLSDHFIKDE